MTASQTGLIRDIPTVAERQETVERIAVARHICRTHRAATMADVQRESSALAREAATNPKLAALLVGVTPTGADIALRSIGVEVPAFEPTGDRNG